MNQQYLRMLSLLCLAMSLAACSGSGTNPPVTKQSINVSGGINAVAATPPPLSSPVTPLPADALADSIGINTHISNYMSARDWRTIVARFGALGVRHVRDGILDTYPAFNTAMTQLLSTSNAKLDGMTDCVGIEYYPQSPTPSADIRQFNSAIGNRLEYVEGPNEVDARNDPNWVSDTISCLPSLRGAIPDLPFIAPSLANPYSDAGALGNISKMVDFGNIHRYFSGRSPETRGWGETNSCGVYGNILWAMCEARINSVSKPIMTTETGYNSETEVDETTQAKYLSRALLVNLMDGIPHTYLYVLKDYTGDGFGGDGLMRIDDTEKPAYTAIHSLMSYFSDLGGPVALKPLAYSLSAPGIESSLFAKRNGTCVLALWNPAPSWNPTTNVPIAVTPQQVTLTFATMQSAVAAVALTDAGKLASKGVTTSGSSITLSVDDHVTLLSFTTP